MTDIRVEPGTIARAVERALEPLEQYAHQCHGASLEVLRKRVVSGRVARGSCVGVGGQHSWVVVGDDCYDRNAFIIDPTLWSYTGEDPYVWVGTARHGLHLPHGSGSIWETGRPPRADETGEEPITLDAELSGKARSFLRLCGPMGRTGWSVLLHSPVDGWPAAEIINAACDDPRLSPIIPIDIVGMVTDRNPEGLYLVETP